jgi:CheY-like chemotaxis protein
MQNLTEKKLKCILLVDDDEITNSIHKMVIEDVGASKNIEVAESVDVALQLLECPKVNDCKTPEIIFLDLNMPGMTGWDFLESYRTQKKNCEQKSIIFILTNSTNPHDRIKAEKYEEVAGFRSKPLTDLMIHEIINRYFPS